MTDTLFSKGNGDGAETADLFDKAVEGPQESAAAASGDAQAIPLKGEEEQLIAPVPTEPTTKKADGSHWDGSEQITPSRALTLSDFVPQSASPVEQLMRFAYRLGVPGSTLAAPLRKPRKTRITATVESPLIGDRAAGMALRAGHFLIHGVKAPIAQMDFAPAQGRLTPPFERVIHGFGWLRDLAVSGDRGQCAPTAERVCEAWLKANPKPDKSDAWKVENTGNRLLAWLVHAPMLLSNGSSSLRADLLAALEVNARHLDFRTPRENDRLAEIAGWSRWPPAQTVWRSGPAQSSGRFGCRRWRRAVALPARANGCDCSAG